MSKSKNVTEKEVLTITREALIRDFGSMADLPHEFANTIANVYYRYYALVEANHMEWTSVMELINSQITIFNDFGFASKLIAMTSR